MSLSARVVFAPSTFQSPRFPTGLTSPVHTLMLSTAEHGAERASAVAATSMAVSVLLEFLFGQVASDGSSDGS